MAERRLKLTKTSVAALPDAPEGGKQMMIWDTEIRGFGLRIAPAGTKSFIMQRRVGRQTRRVTIGRVGDITPEAARRKATILAAEFAEGVDPVQTRQEAARRAHTLREAMEAYITAPKKKGVGKGGVKKARTQRDIRTVLQRKFADWMDKPLADITEAQVKDRHAALAKGQAFLNWALGNGDFAVPEGADSRPTTLRDVTGGFGAFDHVPQTGAGRFANRVGQEIGASALPAGAAMAYGGRFVPAAGGPAVAHEGVRQLVEPFVRNPGAALSREMAGATAAGVGAATANATHEAITGGQGGTWWTDFVGGLGGLGVAGAVEGLARTGADIYRRVSNDPRYQQKIAGEAVADRLIDNSTVMQGEHFAGRPLDAQVLAQRLDQPTALEDLVPGYRAGTADRSGDSRLRSLAYNTEALAPGAANVRRERNMGAVGDFIRGLVPDGDGAAFLDGVRTAAAGIVDDATTAATAARGRLDDALEAVRPRMQPIDRGQQIRDDLTAVFDERTADYRRAYDARDAAMAGDRIDAAAPYRALQDEADRLTTYERNAYVPGDIMSSARELAPDGAPPAEATGLLDMFGNPVMRAPADPRQTDIPLSEALALRHGLTTRQREALAAGRAPEHRALSRLSEGLRSTIDDAMSPETRALDAQARELRRGVAADFEDGNLPSRILDTTGRGRDRMPAEAVGPRVTAGETPYRDTMRLAGARDGTRAAVRDQVLG